MPCLKLRMSFIKCSEPINTMAKAARLELWKERLEPLDASVDLNISADEHLPAGAENPWTNWKALNWVRTQVGRSRVNMLVGNLNEPGTCHCGLRQTMQHLLVCPMMDTACSTQDLIIYIYISSSFLSFHHESVKSCPPNVWHSRWR